MLDFLAQTVRVGVTSPGARASQAVGKGNEEADGTLSGGCEWLLYAYVKTTQSEDQGFSMRCS